MIDITDIIDKTQDIVLLYVEDNEDTREATLSILNDFFDHIIVGVDGVDGLEKYIKFKEETGEYLDLIITDINMPLKDGIEMINDIHNINPEQVTTVISAYNDSEYLMKLIEQGVDHFILKPIKAPQLMNTIYKTCMNIKNRKEKEQFLIHQAQFASMGEMIDSIAHQWLQPINVIKMQTNLLKDENNDEIMLSREDISNYINKQTQQIEHIVDTLEEFRSFFRPNTNLEIVSYKTLVDSVLLLLKDNIIGSTVVIYNNTSEDLYVSVIKNEFKHILINIINNAIDAFKDNSFDNRHLSIETSIDDGDAILSIHDNAGGIPEDIIDKVFQANITTKAKEKGTGMGLYLCTQIVKKINGNLTVSNINKEFGKGVQFDIILKHMESNNE